MAGAAECFADKATTIKTKEIEVLVIFCKKSVKDKMREKGGRAAAHDCRLPLASHLFQ
jgi:hypothetical protein